MGIPADRIGLMNGVHLVIDAGSAGSTTFPCFRDYVIPAFKTDVKAFLNISRIGLVTKQPYFDRRNLDVAAAAECLKSNSRNLLLGIKVLSSGLVVEDAGMLPMEKALEAAESAGCRIMAHLVEGPPANEETMRMLRKGDIITHCFHGAPNIAANKAATKSVGLNPAYCSMDNVMWNRDGTPTKPLEDALKRGVLLDVGHGAASFDQFVAKAAIGAGMREFSISTDAHIRNIDGVVRSLPFTMSKFLALGMTLNEVVSAVTVIPAGQLGIEGWCDDIPSHSSIFRLRAVNDTDPPFLDANRTVVDVDRVVEPLAVFHNKKCIPIVQNWEKLQ